LKGWFVTGTDTGVGKTLIASGMAASLVKAGFEVAVMKPVAAGCVVKDKNNVWEDVEALSSVASVKGPIRFRNPYRFQDAVAPHLAAEKMGVKMQLDVVMKALTYLGERSDFVVVEGVGGMAVPFNDSLTMADIAQAMDLPVIMVVGLRIGCLSHALLTYEAIVSRGLEFSGWVPNILDPEMSLIEENIEALSTRFAQPPLICVPRLRNPIAQSFVDLVERIPPSHEDNFMCRLKVF